MRGPRILIRVIDSLIDLVVLLLLLLLLAYGIYALWDTRQVYAAAHTSSYEMYKPTETDTESFQTLQEKNPEVFGWLTVYGTQIDYPLAQAENNTKYVNTDAEGNYSLAGSLFLDCGNAKDFSDFNSIIYGHHMKQDAMFGGLHEFAEEEYFTDHLYGSLYCGGARYGLEFFAFLRADAYDGLLYGISERDRSGRQEYLDALKERAVRYREVGVSADDRIVLLSTCTNDSTNGRELLAARISDRNYADPFQDTQTGSEGIKKTVQTAEGLPRWWYAMAGLAVIVGIGVLCLMWSRSAGKKKRNRGGKNGQKRKNHNQ